MYDNIKKIGDEISNLFNELDTFLKPGITSEDIDNFCYNFFLSKNLKPAALNYKGFPKSVCVSINNIVCHGVPNTNEIIKENDIISIDAAATDGEFFSDACQTFLMSKAEKDKIHIQKVTHEALWLAISIVKPGVRTGDIGYVLETFARINGYSVIRDFCGHGIGEKLHMHPSVPFYGIPFSGYKFKAGDFFTIEPMIFNGKNLGVTDVKISEDNWTATILNGNISAQEERTIMVTNDGFEVLTYTKSDKLANKPQKSKAVNFTSLNFKPIIIN